MPQFISVLFMLLSSFMLSACIDGTLLDFSPNTHVYLANNTPQSFTVSIQVSGDAPLKEGQDWIRYSDTLAPYSNARLLTLERNKGFALDKNYRFDIQLSSAAAETVTLQQRIRGSQSNSDMQFGAYVSDLALRLFADTKMHRLSSNFIHSESMASEIAIHAKKKARYDDIYYAITAAKDEPIATEDANQLSVLSYNLWALPLVAKDIEERLQAIPAYIQGYDVILFQEAFSDHRQAFFLELSKNYPYQTRMLDKEGVNVHDGGVIIFSRFPILSEAQAIFPDCADADCLADKGINYAEVNKNGRVYHVFATHAASFDTAQARAYRQKQFQQMHNFAQSLAIPASETVIYGGDLNVNKLKFPDDYQSMLSNLDSDEPLYAGYTSATYDPRVNIHATAAFIGGTVEYLDYVLVSNKHKPVSSNINRVKVPRSSADTFWQIWDLSDHFPVAATLQ